MTISRKHFKPDVVCSHRNYVVWFGNGRIKIGITGNLRKRTAYYRQEARRHGLGGIDVIGGQPVPKGVAHIVEHEIRRAMAGAAVYGHREWFKGDFDLARTLAETTRRMQGQLNEVMQWAQ